MSDPSELDALIDRGLQAVDEEDLDQAEAILEKAKAKADPEHPRVVHLAGLVAWANQDLETATTLLLRAADASPPLPRAQLDCAECLFSVDEIEEAEVQVRRVFEHADVSPELLDEARLLLAQIRLADDDPDDALEVLEEIDAGLQEHPAFLSTRGAVLLASERYDDAIGDLQRAVGLEPEDADLQYQLGIALEHAGRLVESRQAMVKVLQLDRAAWEQLEDDLPEPLDASEKDELRSRLEDVLEELPDPVLKLVGTVPIAVQERATESQVRDGVNPRSVVAFVGERKTDDAEAKLESIIVMRDLLLQEIDDEDEIDGELFYALTEEFQEFFQRPDLVVAEV